MLTYATWYASKRTTSTEISIGKDPSITFADNTTAPLATISAEKAGEFKERLLQTLKGHKFQQLLTQYVNYIINFTRSDARKVGKAKARKKPVVEQVMETVDIEKKVP